MTNGLIKQCTEQIKLDITCNLEHIDASLDIIEVMHLERQTITPQCQAEVEALILKQ